MCEPFSFVTEPEEHGGKRFYFDWKQRAEMLVNSADSHSVICREYNLNEDKCNKYEYNVFDHKLEVDEINSEVNDIAQAREWIEGFDLKKIWKPLVLKPIFIPQEVYDAPTREHISLFHAWKRFYAPVYKPLRARIYDIMRREDISATLFDQLEEHIEDCAGGYRYDRIRDSAACYITSFFDIRWGLEYEHGARLWEAGLMPVFEDNCWKLLSGRFLSGREFVCVYAENVYGRTE